jgi:hypothetical protein
MPIFKFKSHFEAEKALWNFSPDKNYYRRVAELWRFANKLSDIDYPAGVFKFNSLEEANQHRDDLELERAKKKRRLASEASTC